MKRKRNRNPVVRVVRQALRTLKTNNPGIWYVVELLEFVHTGPPGYAVASWTVRDAKGRVFATFARRADAEAFAALRTPLSEHMP